mgnify:CR=1 FL=1|jgi:hypothetical protein|tara:strand:- start:1411 stop:1521 length:111 start_codon:yes stop_codon:yes gene_type:complete
MNWILEFHESMGWIHASIVLPVSTDVPKMSNYDVNR